MKTVPLSIYLSENVLTAAALKAGLNKIERFAAILDQKDAFSDKQKTTLVRALAKKGYDRAVIDGKKFVRLQAAERVERDEPAVARRAEKASKVRQEKTAESKHERAPRIGKDSAVEGVTVRMKQNKMTPGTVVFNEVDAKGKPVDKSAAQIPTLYIRKDALPEKVPTFITLEIKFEK